MRFVMGGRERQAEDLIGFLRNFGPFFYIYVPNQQSKDYLEGYALLEGVSVQVLTEGEEMPIPNRGAIIVTFPDLELSQ